jgi:pimeloyl-ACP methyl ester carboxylesterase
MELQIATDLSRGPSMDATLTEHDVMADLDAGRSRPLTVPAPLAPHRPVLGGPRSVATAAAARAASALHLPAADRLLERLWFTPWTVGRVPPRPEGAHPFDVDLDDGRLSGWHLGDGPTVLLVHGWGGRSTDLARLGARLAGDGHRVVAADLPAHGASPGDTTDLFELATAVRAVADRAGPLHGVVAHSLGSVAALLALADGLAAPRAVVLAPPAALDGAVMRFVDRAGLSPDAEARLRRRIEHRYGADVWQRLHVADTAPRVAADVLVVHDVDDRDVPVGEGVRVARALGTEPVLTTGLGHGRVLVDGAVAAHVAAHLAA